ncbi:protein of unknown function [Marinobacter sp. LV10R510-11A]|uniref:DUF4172 domain-containing protein n=1 Tax=Marinobacter sp. LV10R510-11A TaxID=1415568 RepID=UPI000BBF9FB6|nr:DUF4172 domain-containing protein [Marinobacter sp. LV10R510-11A]SOB74609.1 protein of unknown function [Marinobacter sp. LV10R510-11A]
MWLAPVSIEPLAVVSTSLGREAKLDLLVSAAIETSVIEGEVLNREDVRRLC